MAFSPKVLLLLSFIYFSLLCPVTNGSQGFTDVPAYSQILIRQLNHLKRVMVTPAVCQLFFPLNRGFKYWYWADVTFCTSRYRLAESLVFVKQSDPPSNCILELHSCEHNFRNPLNRSYRARLPSSLN